MRALHHELIRAVAQTQVQLLELLVDDLAVEAQSMELIRGQAAVRGGGAILVMDDQLILMGLATAAVQ